ncbi:MAG: family 78 glycoside hydrolase catalytic domain [Clostridiales bacterium]|jgi:alpha-L-rhamnosidase|nr:family 78 glycoside hydrolase catalytic domain [Clostridiales bacterium]
MPFGDAKWIRADGDCESPQFRGSFSVAGKAATAKIRICGLGYFELWINGGKVSDDVLVPAWSDYHERDMRELAYPIRDTFRHRCYYLEYDVAHCLREGENVLGVWLGNGWYNQRRRAAEGKLAYGLPKLCFLLEWETDGGATGRYGSGEGLLWRESEILENNIYFGESHDLSRRQPDWASPGADASGSGCGWRPVLAIPAPDTVFQLQDCAPDRAVRSICPKAVLEDGGRRIYDCGENISGWVELDLPGRAGAEVVVTHAEEYSAAAGALDFDSAGGSGQMQTDRYRSGAEPAAARPRFCWHGFRYFQVEGDAAVREVRVVHADHRATSAFESSDPTLNWLYDAYVRTQLSNIHGGVPSDCPHRERLGYTGDGQLAAEAAMLCLDVRDMFRKWMRDIADGQDPASGHVQHTAPFYGGGGGPGGWGCAIWAIPWQYYRHYGDDALLRQHLDGILLWLSYMESRSEGGLVVREEEGGWCLGEWCAPDQTIPDPFVNTYYYAKGLRAALEIGRIIGRPVDEALQKARLRRAEGALRAAYFDKATGSFCGGANGADAFALDLGPDLGLGDGRAAKNLVTRYRELGTLDTGMFGTDLVIDRLFRLGEGALALRVLTADSETSFGGMRRHGATTLWERWDGGGSHSHPMFGGVVRSLFTHILGIRQAPGSAGFADVLVEPVAIPGLQWARGGIATPCGAIRVERDGAGATRVERD